ncbi:tetraacyldisaccharide 4'-kinase [Cesiribacter sp. SM1]|uniref:tetraacyldisaccharide 4'-kinase n=1 Tax=Cesiribacter sp. SM1 TaxID=2861196 RepID=UPI001CD70B62|nr:tetraacyldisaccharide 4'-kinase [Cesiribacter sp. SM1]
MIAPLYPFSILYDGITRSRNQLYDRGWLSAVGSDRMLISVGNLSVGGTGKTPMVEYLLRLLLPHYSLATLSRGYGRSTKGFRLAGPNDSALSLGDEPYQYYRKWEGTLPVAVGENRVLAIEYLLKERPKLEVIVLDDAFQHRRLRPDFNILLTTYQQPFWRDYLLPAGRLRESRKGAKRAQALVITKCPEILPGAEQQLLAQEARKYLDKDVPVFFSTIAYEPALPLSLLATKEPPKAGAPALLLTGLAKPKPLEDWVSSHYKLVGHQQYGDHHQFTKANLEKLQQVYYSHAGTGAIIITSEKDAARLVQPHLNPLLQELPLYYIPIRQRFLEKDSEVFDLMILKSVAEKLRRDS